MTTLTPHDARRCYNAFNVLHSAFYFSPEHEKELTSLGLEAGAMAYFAGRAAPMGPVGAGVVTATFYNFSPSLVARHIPRAWELAGPADVLAARSRITDGYLTRMLGSDVAASQQVAEAAALALRAAEACGSGARPLYAANADLPVPDAPHLALWHATTLLREHRGDGHLVALAEAELDGLEALVTHTATGKGFTPRFCQKTRGWSEQEWAAAQERLRERGLLDAAGELTDAGTELRRTVEDTTDRLAFAPYRHLGEEGVARLTELAAPLTRLLLEAGAIPTRHLGKG
ncbi:hypothetical protein POF50_033710 [Streptomyces sp. SL13]|uniref:SalK n=1 Tax=Streptantibioticus silvisoli TaxID=2705255 RepID=A0AA90H633_9ACTN|nr:hypothetical protein [Streptantibioticus silvisoli]MDI5967090.1 hypothetical protein [Streptantibioticus silvisoli]MDI5974244.1 hypothetical protein [Streptantibioticus silvisoli]